jgi:hypothetical protein
VAYVDRWLGAGRCSQLELLQVETLVWVVAAVYGDQVSCRLRHCAGTSVAQAALSGR